LIDEGRFEVDDGGGVLEVDDDGVLEVDDSILHTGVEG
jgi:hypothetical protein